MEGLKPSITHFLIAQAKDTLKIGLENTDYHPLYKEVQFSMNIQLLLGLTLEGIINEIGEYQLDPWTWTELEKASTPLKWRLISGLKKGFEPGKKPLTTVSALQAIRNQIAHPKPKERGEDMIVELPSGEIKINPDESWKLPDGPLTVYGGYQKFYETYNYRTAHRNIILTLEAIKEIRSLLELKNEFYWVDEDLRELRKITIPKRKTLK